MNIIIGMDLPENCMECPVDSPICDLWTYSAFDGIEGNPWFIRHPNCQLIKVSAPHGRLGDLDKLEQMFVDIDNAPYSGFDGEEPFYSAEDAAQIIRLTPTIIPASDEGET